MHITGQRSIFSYYATLHCRNILTKFATGLCRFARGTCGAGSGCVKYTSPLKWMRRAVVLFTPNKTLSERDLRTRPENCASCTHLLTHPSSHSHLPSTCFSFLTSCCICWLRDLWRLLRLHQPLQPSPYDSPASYSLPLHCHLLGYILTFCGRIISQSNFLPNPHPPPPTPRLHLLSTAWHGSHEKCHCLCRLSLPAWHENMHIPDAIVTVTYSEHMPIVEQSNETDTEEEILYTCSEI